MKTDSASSSCEGLTSVGVYPATKVPPGLVEGSWECKMAQGPDKRRPKCCLVPGLSGKVQRTASPSNTK
eukprot:15459019-Alexandrium_andersonii.AAC.1